MVVAPRPGSGDSCRRRLGTRVGVNWGRGVAEALAAEALAAEVLAAEALAAQALASYPAVTPPDLSGV